MGYIVNGAAGLVIDVKISPAGDSMVTTLFSLPPRVSYRNDTLGAPVSNAFFYHPVKE